MTQPIFLQPLLTETDADPAQQLTLFALLNLGILDSLTAGTISATDAIRLFFHAENCFFVHHKLRDQHADAIMSHGVQLPDLFDILSPREAQREFQRELATMRAICLTLLGEKQLAA